MPGRRRRGGGRRGAAGRIRKPVAPPGHAFPDRRERLREELDRDEIEESARPADLPEPAVAPTRPEEEDDDP